MKHRHVRSAETVLARKLRSAKLGVKRLRWKLQSGKLGVKGPRVSEEEATCPAAARGGSDCRDGRQPGDKQAQSQFGFAAASQTHSTH